MYKVFEPFLRVSTWHTTHPNDEERFHLALDQVVRNSHFDPEEMAAFFREHCGIEENSKSPFNDAIERCQDSADHIRSFLLDTKR